VTWYALRDTDGTYFAIATSARHRRRKPSFTTRLDLAWVTSSRQVARCVRERFIEKRPQLAIVTVRLPDRPLYRYNTTQESHGPHRRQTQMQDAPL
jgi:hypothetical protein